MKVVINSRCRLNVDLELALLTFKTPTWQVPSFTHLADAPCSFCFSRSADTYWCLVVSPILPGTCPDNVSFIQDSKKFCKVWQGVKANTYTADWWWCTESSLWLVVGRGRGGVKHGGYHATNSYTQSLPEHTGYVDNITNENRIQNTRFYIARRLWPSKSRLQKSTDNLYIAKSS